MSRRKPDARGRLQYVNKTTPAEIERRRDHAYRLYREGYLRSDITEALGISESQLSTDLSTRGVSKHRRYKALVEGKPPRTLWRDEDIQAPPDPTAHYLNSLALAMIDNAVEHMSRERTVNLLAHDVHDALKAGDEAWVSQARSKVARASLYFRRLHAVIDSQSVREQGMRDAGIEPSEVPPALTLRVVNGE